MSNSVCSCDICATSRSAPSHRIFLCSPLCVFFSLFTWIRNTCRSCVCSISVSATRFLLSDHPHARLSLSADDYDNLSCFFLYFPVSLSRRLCPLDPWLFIVRCGHVFLAPFQSCLFFCFRLHSADPPSTRLCFSFLFCCCIGLE